MLHQIGTRLQNYWQTWLDLGAGPKVVQILKEGYTLPFRIQPKLARSPTVLRQSPQEPLPAGGITSAYSQKRRRASRQSEISGVFQPTISSAKAKQQMETYTRSVSKSFPKGEMPPFTVVAKEVKLMAIHKGIRIHQYLDDWLVRARSHQACLQHTQDLVKMCQQLGWLVNLDKSELEPKQVFNFVGDQFILKSGWV